MAGPFVVGKQMRLYITHVGQDLGTVWLTIWGQTDASTSNKIASVLESLKPVLDAGHHMVPPGQINLHELFCTKFSGDQKWYRSKVVDLSKFHLGVVRVNFVDYGNSEEVSVGDIRRLDAGLASHRQQANQFILADTVAADVNWSQEAISFCFNAIVYEHVVAMVMGTEGNVPAIKIVYGDKNSSLSRELVTMGMACRRKRLNSQQINRPASPPTPVLASTPIPGTVSISTSSSLLASKSFSNTQMTMQYGHIPLCVPRQYEACVVHVESPLEFYVHLVQARREFMFDSIMNGLGFYVKSVSPNRVMFARGNPCVAINGCKGRVCRGVVMDLIEDCRILKILFVDFGNVESKLATEVYSIPQDSMNAPAMALRVKLENAVSGTPAFGGAFAALQELDENFPIQCHVLSVDTEQAPVYTVRLSGDRRFDLTVPIPTYTTPALPPTPMHPQMAMAPNGYQRFVITTGYSFVGTMCDITSPTDFYMRPVEYEDSYLTMHDHLQSFNDTPFPVNWEKPGTPLCVRSTECGQWYRGEVQCSVAGMSKIFFVDTGKTEMTHASNLRPINGYFLSCIPALAMWCSLEGFLASRPDTDDGVSQMQAMVQDRQMSVTVTSSQGDRFPLSVQLYDLGAEVQPFYVNMHLRSRITSWDPETIKIPKPELSKEESVFVTSFNSMLSFSCQLSKFPMSVLEDLQEELNAYYGKLHAGEKTLGAEAAAGWFCCTQFSDDKSFYRSQIMSKDGPNALSVRFVDYGNMESKQIPDLKKLMPRFIKVPQMSVRCRCVDSPLPGINQDVISDVLLNQTVDLEFLGINDKEEHLVSFVRTSKANAAILKYIFLGSDDMELKPAASTLLQYKNARLGSLEDVIVTCFTSPYQFWCQRTKSSGELDKLLESIKKLTKDPKKLQPLLLPGIGQACLAFFPSDGIWYRALIQDIQSGLNKVKVEYVDYGNATTVSATEIRTIPASLMEFPRQAIECSLLNFPKMILSIDVLSQMENEMLNMTFAIKVQGPAVMGQPLSVEFDDDNGKDLYARICPGKEDHSSKTWEKSRSGRKLTDDGKSSFGNAADRKLSDSGWRNKSRENSHATRQEDPFPRRSSSDGNWRRNPSNLNSGEKGSGVHNGFVHDQAEKETLCRSPTASQANDRNGVGPAFATVSPEQAKPSAPTEYPKMSDLVGHCKDIFVSHVVSPSEFYCNLTENGAAFKELCSKLKSDFSGREDPSSRIAESDLKVGAVCCARYPEDGNWYRALVRDIPSSGGSARVYYVDYGSESTLPVADLRRLRSDHAVLPAQSLLCTLFDTKPRCDSWTMADKEAFEARVLNVALLAKFVECRASEGYAVQLIDTSKLIDVSINRELITRGQARPFITNSNLYRETVAANMKNPFIQPVIEAGAMLQVRLVWVVHPAQFYCHLLRNEAELEHLEQSLNAAYGNKDTARGQVLTDPKLNQACASFYKGAWYRACIVEVDLQSLVLFYVDYGNIERVSPNDVRILKSEFLRLPYQAVKCQLRGIHAPSTSWAKANMDTMKKYYGGTLEATFHAHCDSCFMVDVSNNGKSVSQDLVSHGLASLGSVSHSSVSQSSAVDRPPVNITDEPMTSKVDLHNQFDAFASHVISPTQFWLQKASDETAISELLGALYEAYNGRIAEDGVESDYKPVVGDSCAAFYPEDDNWYRSTVIAATDDEYVLVSFIDYGNSERILKANVLPLEPVFSKLPAMAIECTLNGLKEPNDGGWLESSIEAFREFVHSGEAPVSALIIEKGERLVVSLSDSGKKAEDLFCDRVVEMSSTPVTPKKLKCFAIPSTKNWDAICSFVYSPLRFYLQAADSENGMIQFSENLVPFDQEFANALTAGDYCVALYEEDGGWYRAVVLDEASKSEGKVQLHFVDYGNDCFTALSDIRALDEAMWSTPIMAVECRLLGARDLYQEDQQELAVDRFNELIDFGENVLKVEVVENDGQSLVVRATVGGVNVADEIKEACGRSGESPEVRGSGVLDPYLLLLNEGDELAVSVTHVESISQFWIQKSVDADAVSQLQKDINAHYQEESSAEGEIGVLFAAKYLTDGCWYRASLALQDESQDEVEIQYVDFGNCDTMSRDHLKKLSHEFVGPRYFAAKCALSLDNPTNKNADIDDCQNDSFRSLINETELEVTIKVLGKANSDGLYQVNLFIGGEDVQDILSECMFQKLKAVNEFADQADTNFPSGEKMAVEIVHIVSPTNFYVLRIDERLDVERVALAMELSQACEEIGYDPEVVYGVGDNCAALNSEEQLWHRGLVLTISKNIFHVHCRDYGYKGAFPQESLRPLPEKFVALPSFSRKCRLADLVVPEADWPEEAVDAFRSLVKEGSGLLLATFVPADDDGNEAPDDTEAVHLLEMGMDVAKALVERGLAQYDLRQGRRLLRGNRLSTVDSADADTLAKEVHDGNLHTEDNFGELALSTTDESQDSEVLVDNEDNCHSSIGHFAQEGILVETVDQLESTNLDETNSEKSDSINEISELLSTYKLESTNLEESSFDKLDVPDASNIVEVLETFSSRLESTGDGDDEEAAPQLLHQPKITNQDMPDASSIVEVLETLPNQNELDKTGDPKGEVLYQSEIAQEAVSETSATTKAELPLNEDQQNLDGEISKHCIPQMVLPIDVPVEIILSFVASPRKFWVTRASDKDKLQSLQEELSSFYGSASPSHGPFSDATIAETCVVHDLTHGFCRAAITKTDGADVVHLLDMGCPSPVNKDELYRIDSLHLSTPRLATRCSLRLSSLEADSDCVLRDLDDSFMDLICSVGESRLDLIPREQLTDGYAVDLLLDGVDVREFLNSDHRNFISMEAQLPNLDTEEETEATSLNTTFCSESSEAGFDQEGSHNVQIDEFKDATLKSSFCLESSEAFFGQEGGHNVQTDEFKHAAMATDLPDEEDGESLEQISERVQPSGAILDQEGSPNVQIDEFKDATLKSTFCLESSEAFFGQEGSPNVQIDELKDATLKSTFCSDSSEADSDQEGSHNVQIDEFKDATLKSSFCLESSEAFFGQEGSPNVQIDEFKDATLKSTFCSDSSEADSDQEGSHNVQIDEFKDATLKSTFCLESSEAFFGQEGGHNVQIDEFKDATMATDLPDEEDGESLEQISERVHPSGAIFDQKVGHYVQIDEFKDATLVSESSNVEDQRLEREETADSTGPIESLSTIPSYLSKGDEAISASTSDEDETYSVALEDWHSSISKGTTAVNGPQSTQEQPNFGTDMDVISAYENELVLLRAKVECQGVTKASTELRCDGSSDNLEYETIERSEHRFAVSRNKEDSFTFGNGSDSAMTTNDFESASEFLDPSSEVNISQDSDKVFDSSSTANSRNSQTSDENIGSQEYNSIGDERSSPAMEDLCGGSWEESMIVEQISIGCQALDIGTEIEVSYRIEENLGLVSGGECSGHLNEENLCNRVALIEDQSVILATDYAEESAHNISVNDALRNEVIVEDSAGQSHQGESLKGCSVPDQLQESSEDDESTISSELEKKVGFTHAFHHLLDPTIDGDLDYLDNEELSIADVDCEKDVNMVDNLVNAENLECQDFSNILISDIAGQADVELKGNNCGVDKSGLALSSDCIGDPDIGD